MNIETLGKKARKFTTTKQINKETDMVIQAGTTEGISFKKKQWRSRRDLYLLNLTMLGLLLAKYHAHILPTQSLQEAPTRFDEEMERGVKEKQR